MSPNDLKPGNLPNNLSDNELWDLLKEAEQELGNRRFISAYNRLEKAKKLLYIKMDESEYENMKQKYNELSNQLNMKIIGYIQEKWTQSGNLDDK